jgi:hypothetical protein
MNEPIERLHPCAHECAMAMIQPSRSRIDASSSLQYGRRDSSADVPASLMRVAVDRDGFRNCLPWTEALWLLSELHSLVGVSAAPSIASAIFARARDTRAFMVPTGT